MRSRFNGSESGDRGRRRASTRLVDDRGAALVHVAIALVGLLSFSALVVDYGLLWSARRQAQNAADAGAMAAAVSMAFVDMNDQNLARTAAINTATQNLVWGEAPDIVPADVTFPPCPPGSPAAGSNACVRVNVFRNQRAGGNPLPTIFGRLVGVDDQGVRATATAQILFGDSTDCVKPWAIPDKWEERNPTVAPWDPDTSEFNRYQKKGNDVLLLSPADWYQRPGAGAINNGLGTGFTRESVTGSDYGYQMIIKPGAPENAISPSVFNPIIINPDCTSQAGTGKSCYEEAIASCSPLVLGPGDTVQIEPGAAVGPTAQGTQELIAKDPDAYWYDPDGDSGPTRGYIRDGCQADDPPCVKSPRLVPIPVYDPDEYDQGRQSGRQTIVITKILGFFIERMQGNDVVGRLMTYPSAPRFKATDSNVPGASFIVSIALVR